MPKQYMIFGRPMPRITTRRLTFALFLFSLFALVSLSSVSSRIPAASSLAAIEEKLPSVPKPNFKIPEKISKSKYNPWRAVAHPPHRTKHDEYKGSSWWSDWTWLSVPFSTTISSDDDRALLPDMPARQPVYCYYDAEAKKPRGEKDAESALLLTWRRAWWAQGFAPVIIGPLEAKQSSLYGELQYMNLDKEIKADMMRWLAWESQGAGLLAQCLTFPMGKMKDKTLVFLRRGGYPSVTTWKDLGSGLVAGQKDDVREAIKTILNPKLLESVKTVLEAIHPKYVVVDKDSSAVSYYSPKVKESYGHHSNSTKRGNDKVQNMKDLNLIINAHLHSTWQRIFRDGVAVLQPLRKNTGPMVQEAAGYANALVACPKSPEPDKCPPNFKECKPCEGEKSSLKILTPSSMTKKPTVFTIGTVPHPWTLAVMNHMKDDIDVPFIRRKAERDPWLTAITRETLGTDVSASARVIAFKEAVAGEYAAFHNLWLQAELDTPTDLAWRFGFALPNVTGAVNNDGQADKESASEKETRARQRELLEGAKKVVAMKKSSKQAKIRASMEAWNMGDTEAWFFSKAFLARRLLERVRWEQEEEKFAGGAGSEGGRNAFNRWSDLKDGEEGEDEVEDYR